MVEFEVTKETILLPVDLLLMVDLKNPLKVIKTIYDYALISTNGMMWEEIRNNKGENKWLL